MKSITVSFAIAMAFFSLWLSPAKAFSAEQYVVITEPFVNVYATLDPKSTVIRMVKKNDRLELIDAGSAWYSVKIDSKQGWVERKAGHVVDSPSVFSPVLSIFLVIIVLAGAMYGVSFYLKKQKKGLDV